MLFSCVILAIVATEDTMYTQTAGRGGLPGEDPVWISFTDKGEAQGVDVSGLLEHTGRRLVPAARARREKSRDGALVDYLDLPVHRGYVDEIRRRGVRVRHVSRWLNAVSADVTPEEEREILELPFVRDVRPVKRLARSGDRTLAGMRLQKPPAGRPEQPGTLPIRPFAVLTDTAFYGPAFYQLDEIGVPAVHDSGYTGAGILLGMLDTGYYKVHESLRDLDVVAEWDFVFADSNTQNEAGDVDGQHNHGTATWSALGGYLPYSMIGPAFGASFFIAKTEDIGSETPVEEDHYVAALEWSDSLGVSVTSASLAYKLFDEGFPSYDYEDLDGNTATITVAVDIAASRGILVCNAISNNGYEGPGSLWTPADADSMLAVGAVDAWNEVAGFSSRGPTYDGRTKPEVVARGVETYCASAQYPSAYGYAGGTSLSTPLVGGAVALVMEAHPEWDAMQVRDALMMTADNALDPDNDRGWGRIDVHAAIYDIEPPVYPVPFSLLLPADGDSVGTGDVAFAWQPTRDPDNGGAITYRLVVAADPEFVGIVHQETTADTVLTVSGVFEENTVYYWSVLAVDDEKERREARHMQSFSTAVPTGIGPEDGPPRAWSGLLQNYPNPFNPSTVITYSVEGGDAVPVMLEVFDLRGRRVATIVDGPVRSGTHAVNWNGRSEKGGELPSGVYLYRLTVNGNAVTRKMNLLK